MLSNEELNAIKERAEKATEGPWVWDEYGDLCRDLGDEVYSIINADRDGFLIIGESDETFIANSREDIPKLLAHISEQSTEIKDFKSAIRNLDALVDSVRYRINSQQDVEDVANEIAGIISDLERKVGEVV